MRDEVMPKKVGRTRKKIQAKHNTKLREFYEIYEGKHGID